MKFYIKTKTFLREVLIEMKRITWLTKREILNYTLIVLAVSFVVGVILGIFDFVLFNFLNRII